ncbi:MAG TPA: redoxin domain-containing protein [Flavilitoribacter sp.]|nr:redoxin domain-containing protein [Flavilitoribacter sp.]
MFLIAGLLLAGCKPAGARDQGAEDAEAAVFAADPQPVPEQPVETLPIGSQAPDFNLPATDGKFYTLGDFAEAQVLVIVFTCNHCPTAQAYEDRMKAIAAEYKRKGVELIAISPNSPLGLLYEELGYTDLGDDFEDMKIRAEHKQYNFPYLYDGDTESASLQYGPVATPHAFVFDKDRKLRYTGRIDKVEKPGGANGEDLRNAIDAVLAGKEIAEPATKTFGCSTKWAWKTEYKVKMEKEWEEKPVEVAKLDLKGIQDLMKNEGSDKLRLVNVWATWCGPCILEYPEFIVLQRMYGARSFEFVSLSADKPQEEEKVLAFLRGKYSAAPNYLYNEEDKYALIDAVDKNWNGALPYTALIEPGGKIVWSHQGSVDFLALKRAIVEHPMMGRYY